MTHALTRHRAVAVDVRKELVLLSKLTGKIEPQRLFDFAVFGINRNLSATKWLLEEQK